MQCSVPAWHDPATNVHSWSGRGEYPAEVVLHGPPCQSRGRKGSCLLGSAGIGCLRSSDFLFGVPFKPQKQGGTLQERHPHTHPAGCHVSQEWHPF